MRWRRPKWLGPCDQMCPIEVERRIAAASRSEPVFVIGQPTQDEIDASRVRVVAEMRRIVAEEFPPPCKRCPSRREAAK